MNFWAKVGVRGAKMAGQKGPGRRGVANLQSLDISASAAHQVRPVVTSYAADLGASHNAADIQAALWPEAHGIEMVSRFLRDAAQVEDPGLKYGKAPVNQHHQH